MLQREIRRLRGASAALAVLLALDSSSAFAAEEAPSGVACPLPKEALSEITLDVGAEIAVPPGFNALAFHDQAANRPIKDLTARLESSRWTVNSEDLTLPATPYRHIEQKQIVLAWSNRSDEQQPQICLQAFSVRPYPSVIDAGCGESRCGLGDKITVRVLDLDAWIKDRGLAQGRQAQQTVADLVLFLDGVPIRGVHPENPATRPDENAFDFRSEQSLRFTLERNANNRDDWTRLLSGLKWDRFLDLSIGFDGGDSMPSWVLRNGPARNDPAAPYFRTFQLEVLPYGYTMAAGLVFLFSVGAFLALVKRSEILRDVSAPLRPDGKSPYSLARVQMAVWFFLVVAAWFLLFLVTKDIDTLTGSVLVLIGISAGTAVGSAIIDAGTTIDAAERYRNIPTDPTKLGQRVTDLRADLEKERTVVTNNDQEAERKHTRVKQVASELTLAKSQEAFFRQKPWLRAMTDLLGDDGHISFHRFQVAVWTVVLAFVFIVRVVTDLAMPEFSATVLGLMGISSGTYLGFKLPAASGAGTQSRG